jgi:hypothetical protein
MDWLMLVLRIAHIGGAVLWAGGAVMFLGYVAPTTTALGPRGEAVMQDLLRPRRLPAYFAIVSTITIVAGAALYWRDTGGLMPSAVSSTFGLVFGLGGLAGGFAWIVAVVIIPRAVGRIQDAATELRAAGDTPSADQLHHLRAAQDRLRRTGWVLLTLLAIAVVMMSIGRYVVL